MVHAVIQKKIGDKTSLIHSADVMSLPCHPVFSPPFHNETDHRHLDCVSDLDQCVCGCVCASATPLEHTEQVSGTCLLVDMTCYEYLEGVLLELTKTKQIEKNEAFSRKTIEYHRHIILDASLRPLPPSNKKVEAAIGK